MEESKSQDSYERSETSEIGEDRIEFIHVDKLIDKKAKGRSNIIFEEEILSHEGVFLHFKKIQERPIEPNYNLRDWISEPPFSDSLSVIDFHEETKREDNFRHVSLRDIEDLLESISKHVEKIKSQRRPPKRTGLIWKCKVKRR